MELQIHVTLCKNYFKYEGKDLRSNGPWSYSEYLPSQHLPSASERNQEISCINCYVLILYSQVGKGNIQKPTDKFILV